MLVRKAFEGDINYIVENLSQVTIDELTELNRPDLEMRENILKSMQTFPAQVLVKDGKAIAALGCERDESIPTALFTWFICTEDFWDLGVRGVVFGRKYMKELAKKHPECGIYTLSASPHPDQLRWFELLGGKFLKKEGGLSVYAF